MRDESVARRTFWTLFVVVLLVKALVAARLPLFVDEAFYWLEGQRLAAAYSDLPGLTAWLARLGVTLGGGHAVALHRVPVALLGPALALDPGHAAGHRSGCLEHGTNQLLATSLVQLQRLQIGVLARTAAVIHGHPRRRAALGS